MANYTGSECEYCHKRFNANDDVVVCPECGTPYHRECYIEAGECVNTELHKNGGEWQQFGHSSSDGSDSCDNNSAYDKNINENESDEEIRCPRCGEKNPSMGLFCVKCGMPLNINQGARPFNDMSGGGAGYNPYGGFGNNGNNRENQQPFGQQPFGQQPYGQPFPQNTINLSETDIEGHKGAKYARFIGKNPVYFLLQFFNLSKKGSKVSFNVMAFLFPEYYFFYRKMYIPGIIMLLLSAVLAMPDTFLYIIEYMGETITLPDLIVNNQELLLQISTGLMFVSFASSLLCGLFANYWYFKKAKKTIDKFENMDISEDEKNILITQNGGTSGLALAMGITASIAIVIVVLIGVMMFL